MSATDPYPELFQGFADHRFSGVRNGPVHLFKNPRIKPLCGRLVVCWNFEARTDSDFCKSCMRKAASHPNPASEGGKNL